MLAREGTSEPGDRLRGDHIVGISPTSPALKHSVLYMDSSQSLPGR